MPRGTDDAACAKRGHLLGRVDREMKKHEDKVRFSRLDPEKFGRTPSEPPKAERSTRFVEYLLFAVFAVLIVLAGFALYTSYSPAHKQVPNLVDEGIKQDRINLLLIGVAGDTHIGGGKDLADTVILASLKPSTKQVALISVPRDLYVRMGRFGKHRINLAHSLGNSSGYPGRGPGLLADTVSGVFGQPIHAFAKIDFAAFKEIVDSLGGIEIDVPHRIYDELFRDGFEAGRQTMNGDRALRYARYRYIRDATEGDNFGREMRQQQVIDAIRAKLQQQGPEDVLRLASTARALNKHTETNLSTNQLIWFYRTFRNTGKDKILKISLKPYMQYIRVRAIGEAGSAVQPWNEDYTLLQQIARDPFSGNVPPPPAKVAETSASAQAATVR